MVKLTIIIKLTMVGSQKECEYESNNRSMDTGCSGGWQS